MRLKRLEPDNPILRREILHQERSIPRWLWAIELVGPVIMISILSVYLISTALTPDQYSLPQQRTPRYHTLGVAQLAVWGIHAMTALRAFFEGAAATRRNAGEHEWDSLVLTGISARRILIGQWWAALYRIRGWIVALGLIQLIIVPVFMAENLFHAYGAEVPRASYCLHPQNLSTSYCTSYVPFHGVMLWGAWVAPFNIITAIGLSLLAAGTYTLVGMTLAVILRNQIVAFLVGSLFRFAPAIVFLGVPDYSQALGDLFWRWQEYNWFVVADGGTSALLRMAGPSPHELMRGVYVLFAAIMMFTTISSAAIAILLISLQRKGASPPYI